VITVGIDPTIELGPLTLAWHGLTTAAGVVAGVRLTALHARERKLPDMSGNLAVIAIVAGLIGARAFFLLETDPGALLRPSEWVGTRGFAFNGALIGAGAAIALYVWSRALSARYLDAVALAFPLGMAIGRIGDVINGEHYGAPTQRPWGVRNTHPDAAVPDPTVAYHSGGLYEMVLAFAIFALVWPLRDRFRRPLAPLWLVLGLYALGRFFMFFFRSDSEELALGLNGAQWTSGALFALAVIGAGVSRRMNGRRGIFSRASG